MKMHLFGRRSRRAAGLLVATALTAVTLTGTPAPAQAQSSDTLTVAWPEIYSFVDMPLNRPGFAGGR